MTEITRSEHKQLSKQVVEAAQAKLGDGYQVSQEGGQYGDTALMKIRVTKVSSDGKVVTQLAADFTRNALFFGLEPSDLGAIFSTGGNAFKIVGAKPRNRKYPIIAEKVTTGKQYKFPAADIVMFKNAGGIRWTSANDN